MNGSGDSSWRRHAADNRRMSSPSRARSALSGFTLVELMITLAIMAILASLAWPALQEAVQKSRRSDGMAALSTIMQAQERWRANNPTYQSTLASLPGALSTSPDRHYDLSIVDGTASATGYTARATVRSGSPQSGDSTCQVLQVAVNGGNITYSSRSGGGANAAPDPCWVR
jgi:type IV pilus assembly protein PilE